MKEGNVVLMSPGCREAVLNCVSSNLITYFGGLANSFVTMDIASYLTLYCAGQTTSRLQVLKYSHENSHLVYDLKDARAVFYC